MKTMKLKMIEMYARLQAELHTNKAEGYVDTIVKMAIAVVVGALILTVLMAVMGDEDSGFLGDFQKAVQDLFDFSS